MFAYARMNPKTIYYLSFFQSMIWMFVTFMYLINGAFLLAIGIGLTWAVASGYIAYASKNRIAIMAYDRTPQAEEDTANEDQL